VCCGDHHCVPSWFLHGRTNRVTVRVTILTLQVTRTSDLDELEPEPQPEAKDIGRIFYENGQAWTVTTGVDSELAWKPLTSTEVGDMVRGEPSQC